MAPMSQSRPYHHGDLRAALLTSAERTLREKGTSALSLRELARDIGVSHAAPGRHFKDKQALLDALALAGYDRLNDALAAADLPEAPLEPRLTSLARAYLTFATENPELLALMFARKHDPDIDARLADAVDMSMGSFVRLTAEAQQRGEIIEGDPEQLTLAAAAGVHGLASLIAAGALPPDEALVGLEGYIHLVLHGLKPR
ncbi:TetR/AcrR family transcriptional regulator [Streptomyces arenae]|uniref:TetR/AcrR family transcriptional regulator n=1 Tax=Streptomyces arenae TaxID=29301 RepID=UPI002659D532|nr:TetR/AcrR family transcriptional regulator [Streptomyces arenae]MCG7210289.1 TetR/AcrR family transcriptional regulator [Streptomyces arenae]